MRYLIRFGVAALFIGILAGCSELTTDEPGIVGVMPTNAPQAAISPILPSATVTHTEISATAEPAEWQTFTDLTGIVELEYPSDWSVTQTYSDSVSESLTLKSATAEDGAGATEKISVSIHQTAPQAFPTYAPDANVPNEGGIEPYWETPISSSDASGVLYVAARNSVSCPDCDATLFANYFSEAHGLVVIMDASEFPVNLRQEADANGLEATVTEYYPIFDHVMRSIRFAKP